MGDIEAIEQLKARYFRFLDTKDWNALRELFTPDVRIDVSDDGAGTFEGVEAFVAMLADLLGDVVTVHHGHTPEIALNSPTTATGVWAMEDRLWFPEGSELSHVHGYGHYHDTYERRSDGWRIAASRLTRLRVDVT